MSRFRLSRRAVLKGVGAAVALPTLEVMLNSHGTAYAAGEALPKRLMTFFWGNGVILNRWRPTTLGPSWGLSEELAPLADVKDSVSVLSGYDVKTPNLRGHHNGVAAILSGCPFIPLPPGSASYSSKFGGPSIDQVAAAVIGKGTLFPSLHVGVSKRVTRGEGPTLQFIAHQGPDAPLPSEFNPNTVFNRVFASFTPAPVDDPRNGLRASVLDAVREDARRLHQRLGAADRARLDRHLTSIEEVRTRILALPPAVTASCSKPAYPNDSNADVNGQERLSAVSTIMSDLIALAWACDLNRVATFHFSGSVAGTVYSELGHTENEHELTHRETQQGDVHNAVVFVMRNFAYLLKKLQATPDGTGSNLLASSVILASTDVSEGFSHSSRDYPILVAGGARGFLKPGMHVRSTSGENTSNVLLTVLQAAGAGVTSVGKDEGFSSTPVRALHT